jgi:FMN phosphatase YigB (HAD superfamily)
MKIISFDVDGTLVDSSFADLVWLEGVPQLYAEQYHIDVDAAKQKIITEYDRIGEDDVRWYKLDYWFSRFNLKGSYKDLLEKYKDRIVIYEEVLQVLDSLRKKYTLIVASNAHRDFLSLSLSSIKSYFDHVFSATSDFGEVGKYEWFYTKILQYVKVNPDDMVHVGDHYTFDYEIPSKLGVHAFYLDRKGGKGLKNLKEFEEKVKELERI